MPSEQLYHLLSTCTLKITFFDIPTCTVSKKATKKPERHQQYCQQETLQYYQGQCIERCPTLALLHLVYVSGIHPVTKPTIQLCANDAVRTEMESSSNTYKTS